ncbi:hypothetical protein SAMN06298216_0703 [Spirosomataceae bacterium TFI 002]|nr:hypothetical protein SAMN06298216_0703 [Spirosomataceae bacterium TFI 002]
MYFILAFSIKELHIYIAISLIQMDEITTVIFALPLAKNWI